MAGNWGAILAGLAGGASTMGESMDARDREAAAKVERDRAFKRLLDNDKTLADDKDYDRGERKMTALTQSYEKGGVHLVDPTLVQGITGARQMPDITGADGGAAGMMQSITNAATGAGREAGRQLPEAAMKALTSQTTPSGGYAPVEFMGRTVGWAQDPNAEKKAERQTSLDVANIHARATAGSGGRAERTQLVGILKSQLTDAKSRMFDLQRQKGAYDNPLDAQFRQNNPDWEAQSKKLGLQIEETKKEHDDINKQLSEIVKQELGGGAGPTKPPIQQFLKSWGKANPKDEGETTEAYAARAKAAGKAAGY